MRCHYVGDVRSGFLPAHLDLARSDGEVLRGPTLDGRILRAVSAEYDAVTDRTTVEWETAGQVPA